MNHSQDLRPPVPAHRVVSRHALLTGRHHFTGALSMQEILEAEGHVIGDDQIHDVKDVLWDSMT
jgi:methylated-DNA-protein-cysteine methyltransferase-like protein